MTVYAWVREGLRQVSATEFAVALAFAFVQNGSVVSTLPGGGADSVSVIVPATAPHSSSSLNDLLASGLASALNNAFGLTLTDGDIALFGGEA